MCKETKTGNKKEKMKKQIAKEKREANKKRKERKI